ncbi:CKLF-like MARVEL transmembrane domain-containing protein 7 [Ambystoma mexicanum]|uniref:CKLF-like MARVEL transmembrane domain-containing protein 7 n=1 Tax=Ambystoma mexicanum TaxID=8296 RepID=UPI0037E7E419
MGEGHGWVKGRGEGLLRREATARGTGRCSTHTQDTVPGGPAIMSVHVIRTTTSTAPAGQDSGPIDRGYARTVQAMLKVAQMVCLLIGFLCVRCSLWTEYPAYCFFEVVTICDLIMIFIFYLIYVFRIYRSLTCLNWPLAELVHYLIGTLLLAIASIVAISKSHRLPGLVAGGVFGLIASVLCCVSMWASYKVSFVTQSTSAAV